MAKKGSPSITLDGVTFDSDDCLQVASFSVGGTDLTYSCGGYTKTEVGDEQTTLTFSIAMENNDTGQLADIIRGVSGACEYHPFGDTAGNIEHTSTDAVVTSYTENGGPNNIVIADITVAWNDRTSGAAV